MPSLSGQLSEAEKNQIRKKIDDLWRGGGKNCPVCGSAHWIIGDHIVESPIVTEGVRGFGSGYPSVILISDRCGYTMHFNAIVLGIMKRPAGL
jgi:hypothetical protein